MVIHHEREVPPDQLEEPLLVLPCSEETWVAFCVWLTIAGSPAVVHRRAQFGLLS